MSAESPSIGVLLPTRGLLLREPHPQNAELVLSLARRAEAAKLDSVWVGDSLTSKPRLEPLTTLAAIAASTNRVRIGTSVLLAALRHPVLSAHALGTLDVLSGGRLTITAGVGGAFVEAQRKEWLNAGVEPSERAGRLEEWVELVKRLTAGETVSHRGKFFELDAVSVAPRSPQRGGVPVLLATHWKTGSDAQFRRVVRFGDGYIGISDSPQEFASLGQRLREIADAEGRDVSRWDSVFYMTVNVDADEPAARSEADQFIRAYYGLNFWEDKWGPFGSPERVAERMREYAAAGARTLIVRFASLEQDRQLDRFIETVLPLAREA